MNFKDKSCLVIDNGVFVGLAETLARSFGKVGYFAPWETAFSDGHELLIGYGLDGIDRIKYVEQVLNDYDLIVFPDCHDPWFQKSLRDQGHRVWGSSLGCELELSRWKTHELLEKAGVPVPEAYKIIGVPAVREFFKEHPDEDGWYVKVIGFRGLGETWHSSDYDEANPMLDDLEAKHGGVALMVEFVVEHAITNCVEDGYDGLSVLGQFPKESFVGVETKNKAYFGKLTPCAQLPDHIRKVNEAVAPAMHKLGYANFFSTELRDGIPIDLTCRHASPAGEVIVEAMVNLPDVLWNGAEGRLVEPEWSHPYGAQIVFSSDWGMTKWEEVRFPEEIRPHVKLYNHCRMNGVDWVIPDGHDNKVGSVVALGNTPQEAINAVNEMAEQVHGFDLEYDDSALDKAVDEIEALDKNGKS